MGLTLYNYKGYHSITMMALVSGNYEFLYLDMGGEGRQSDGGIWRQCTMKDNLDKKKLLPPKPRKLPGSESVTEMVFVGDKEFLLGPHMVKPFC